MVVRGLTNFVARRELATDCSVQALHWREVTLIPIAVSTEDDRSSQPIIHRVHYEGPHAWVPVHFQESYDRDVKRVIKRTLYEGPHGPAVAESSGGTHGLRKGKGVETGRTRVRGDQVPPVDLDSDAGPQDFTLRRGIENVAQRPPPEPHSSKADRGRHGPEFRTGCSARRGGDRGPRPRQLGYRGPVVAPDRPLRVDLLVCRWKVTMVAGARRGGG